MRSQRSMFLHLSQNDRCRNSDVRERCGLKEKLRGVRGRADMSGSKDVVNRVERLMLEGEMKIKLRVGVECSSIERGIRFRNKSGIEIENENRSELVVGTMTGSVLPQDRIWLTMRSSKETNKNVFDRRTTGVPWPTTLAVERHAGCDKSGETGRYNLAADALHEGTISVLRSCRAAHKEYGSRLKFASHCLMPLKN
ncbi:hypothetical protein EVAR_39971_1 [Eumeta japonica]|uniref:Uncharacterized protein n=1 Tax=Eumeta variegata TaxID=151549 RepID=A0A4C1X0X7_EUMVA|nr:hypothetical protein EVAR_39971_1 [Eumeta japonica]